MPYSRYGGAGPMDNRGPGQNPVPSPWQGGYPGPSGSSGAPGSNINMNLLGTLMNSAGSGNMTNLATSLIAQTLQNKPGGMIIGGNHFPAVDQGSSGYGSANDRFMDRNTRDDYQRRGQRDYHHRGGNAPQSSSSSRRPPHAHRRSRSRSPSRDHRRSRQRGQDDSSSRGQRSSASGPPNKRMRAGSPKDRAPFEIYIGNYPVRFRENDLRNLFQENGVEVSTIRLKHDGHKVFAFAETKGEEEIQKAIKNMDSKEIHGRRLRVRSSKDKDRHDKKAPAVEKKKPAPVMKRELTIHDITKHLVYAFTSFVDRQANKDNLDEDKVQQMKEANDLLKTAFDIPADDSLKVSRSLELIFLQNNRREIPAPVEKPKEEPEEVKEEEAKEDLEATIEIKKEANGDEVEAEEAKGDEVEGDEVEGEEAEEAEEEEDEKDEEDKLVEQLGDAIGNLVEEADQDDQDDNDEDKAEPEDNEDKVVEEPKEEDSVEVEEEEDKAVVNSSPNRGGGRGRGSGRGRRSRGRRGAQ